MGAAESRAEGVPVCSIPYDIEDDGREAGFASEITPEQSEALEAAAVAAAALLISPPAGAAAPEEKVFTVMEEDGEPLATALNDWKLEKQVLGEGAFGKVRLATHVGGDRARALPPVAVKIIKRNKINARAEELLAREVKNHAYLRHENIVRLHTWIKSPSKCAHALRPSGGRGRCLPPPPLVSPASAPAR